MEFTTVRLRDHLAITDDQADQVRRLIQGKIDPFDAELFPRTAKWAEDCYHRPSMAAPESIMKAIAELIEMYDTEAIFADEFAVTRPVMEYCNAGDTYAATIVYDYARERYMLTTYGDWVERYGRRYSLY